MGTVPETPPAHEPYVPDHVSMPEFTLVPIIVGAVLGIVFGASSIYLVLKVGMTVSASIPVAVLSITLFRGMSRLFGLRSATILENNIVQTTGSAGESIAFGVGVTMPALMILGFDMTISRVMLVSVLGGLLGILMMIPLRRAFIVKLHGKPGEPGKLLYPEGTACAQVLISGEKGGTTGLTVFLGFFLAFGHKFVTEGMNLLQGTLSYPITVVNKMAIFSAEMASELLGVGYIIGTRTSSIMMGGAVLGYLVIAPTIYMFGENLPTPLAPATTKTISQMSIREIRENYLLYIGAGCVAAAGVISMLKTLPLIFRSIASGLGTLRGARGTSGRPTFQRTEDDLSLKVVLFGSLALIVILTFFLGQEINWGSAILGAVLVILFGFLFVTVSSRLTGEIGSSSNPISGMTVATLMLTCFLFLTMGMTSPAEKVLALSIGAVVCIAASNGGTTSQDLKTGFLVGATPRLQQLAIIIGALTSALFIGATLLYFNQAGTIYTQKDLPTVNLADKLSQLHEKETYQGHTYYVWRPMQGEYEKVEPGKYLVDDTGDVRYLVDPGIMGRRTHRDDGSKVSREFEAPKTQVMALIINSVLGGKLNWTLLVIGAMIAVTLELCGISSLAFAVGVYVPIQYSVPVFLGGLVRWGLDAFTSRVTVPPATGDAGLDAAARAQAEVEAIARTESSPGVLMASGYIAGGSLAGVLIAFLEFAPDFREHVIDQSERAKEWGLDGPIPAILCFAGLIAILVLVGTGKFLAPASEDRQLN
ncbi:MAG TPA: oligopeptide transporter, OPT family [Gemmataceae bacterium]|jgi:putative OPT family oligopeptide transporter|nr:oligopeptide transporter, OPT family [Gemmataceae bacterium]